MNSHGTKRNSWVFFGGGGERERAGGIFQVIPENICLFCSHYPSFLASRSPLTDPLLAICAPLYGENQIFGNFVMHDSVATAFR